MDPLTFVQPWQCGRRLIPALVDEISKNDPHRPFVSVPVSSNLRDGYKDISFGAYAKAVNRCSWWIEETIGKSETSKVLSYIGPLDIRYLILLLAASKTGHVALFSSHRNSVKAHVSLLEASNCNTILIPDKAPMVVKQILKLKSMDVVATPSLESFLDDVGQVKDYPFRGTFEDLKDNPLVILHTSGSTGIPKPVFVTHGTFASNDAYQMIPFLGGMPTFGDYIKGKRVFLAFPMFHAASIGLIAISVFTGALCVLPPPVPLSVDIIDMVHTFGNLHGSLLPPSLIVEVHQNSEYLENMLGQLKFLAYVGGTLNKDIGDELSTKIKLITLMGTTESMWFPVEIHDTSVDWQYISVSPFFGHTFRPHLEGLNELVIVRNASYVPFQGVFSTFPDLHEYGTSDVYEPNPTKQNAWRCCGRKDDIICFNNAEKLNPVTMETIIVGHTKVKNAIIGGHGQFQASLLIEPNEYPANPDEAEQLINDLWPTVMKANEDCPAHGRILKSFILLTDPAKPFPTTGKGTVQRFAALKLYADELEALYKNAALSRSKKHNEPTESRPPTPIPAKLTSKSPGTTLSQSEAPFLCTPSELDARIERALNQLLNTVFTQRLGPALVQLMSQVCQPLPSPITPKDSRNHHPSSPKDPEPHPPTTAKPNPLPNPPNVSDFTPPTSPSPTPTSSSPSPDSQALKDLLNRAILDTTYLYGVTDDADLFDCGLDSLQAAALVERINSVLSNVRPGAKPIHTRTVYANPSIERLVRRIEAEG